MVCIIQFFFSELIIPIRLKTKKYREKVKGQGKITQTEVLGEKIILFQKKVLNNFPEFIGPFLTTKTFV